MASSSLRKAGSLFGIDLGGLFGTDGEEGGFNLSPFMQFSNTSKGRGGVLNFRPQPQTGTTTSFGFMPQSPGIQNINVVGSNIGQQSNDFLGRYLDGPVAEPTTPTPGGSAPAPISTPDLPQQAAPTGKFADYDFSSEGGAGFGMKDINALLKQGATTGELRDLQSRAESEGLNVGPAAQTLLEKGSEKTKGLLKGFDYGAAGGEGFGMKDVQAIIDMGGTRKDVKKAGQRAENQGLNVGPAVRSLFPVLRNEKDKAAAIAANYDPASAGQAGFGMADVRALTSQGATTKDLRNVQNAAREQGLNVGSAAQTLLQKGSEKTKGLLKNFDYGAAGGKGFGMKDVQALLEMGATRADIKRAGKRAQKQGLNVGKEVQNMFKGLR